MKISTHGGLGGVSEEVFDVQWLPSVALCVLWNFVGSLVFTQHEKVQAWRQILQYDRIRGYGTAHRSRLHSHTTNKTQSR